MASKISRREALQRAAAATAAGAIPAQAWPQPAERYAHLDADEARTLEAVVARLIPSDEHGPGAAEAGAARYIDRALGGALSTSLESYRQGLGALDRYARAAHGELFSALATAQQNSVLSDLQANRATGFRPDAASFFELVREHTLQGTFCDPAYGGNRDFVGWEMLGYPGLRLAVSAEQQSMRADTSLNRLSAYDLPMFDSTGGPDDD